MTNTAERSGQATAARPAGSEPDVKTYAANWIDAHADELERVSKRIWEFAELGFQEFQSSVALAGLLEKHGFAIEWGVGSIPTAFVASWSHGTGTPVIGFSAEYDALPGLSQRAGFSERDPLDYRDDPYAPTIGPGHGCGHNLLGVGSAGGALGLKAAMEAYDISGSIKVFGAPAEEQLAGKAFMARAGVYAGLDACLDWHPGSHAVAGRGSSNAMYSVVFTFTGSTGHGGHPWGNKSALDAVEVLNIMTEYLREENVSSTGRVHYAIPASTGAPNVTTDLAHAWYFIREKSPEDVELLYQKVCRIAEAAAMATGTHLTTRFIAGCWSTLPNEAGAKIVERNIEEVPAVEWTADEQQLVRAIQATLGLPQRGLPEPFKAKPEWFAQSNGRPPHMGGSTDVADISRLTPVLRMTAPTWAQGAPGHHWQIVALSGTSVGFKGMEFASKALAATGIDLLCDADLLQEVRAEFEEQAAAEPYRPLIPSHVEPPVYEPPAWFLEATGQGWPLPGLTWPRPRLFSREQPGKVSTKPIGGF